MKPEEEYKEERKKKRKNHGKNKGGRPKGSKSRPEARRRPPKLKTPEEKIYYWAARGLALVDIAGLFELSEDQLLDWFWVRPLLRDQYEKGLWEWRTAGIEQAMEKRSKGYTYEESTKYERVDPATGELKLVAQRTMTKQLPPSEKASQLCLINRSPKWKGAQTDNVGILLHKAEPVTKPKNAGMTREAKPGENTQDATKGKAD